MTSREGKDLYLSQYIHIQIICFNLLKNIGYETPQLLHLALQDLGPRLTILQFPFGFAEGTINVCRWLSVVEATLSKSLHSKSCSSLFITTNPHKTVLYTGVTNNLERRMSEYYENRGKPESFAGKFYCYNLIYWERFSDINDAIAREKEIKGWKRSKK